jgi:hypothetical protein
MKSEFMEMVAEQKKAMMKAISESKLTPDENKEKKKEVIEIINGMMNTHRELSFLCKDIIKSGNPK